MSNLRRPSSLDGIKRLAKTLKRETGLPHQEALNQAASIAGYENFLHARKALKGADLSPPVRSNSPKTRPGVASRSGKPAPLSEFHARSLASWARAVDAVDPAGKTKMIWTGRTAIARALQAFMGRNANHGHLPTGGGFDFRSVSLSREPGCLEFGIGERLALIAKPALLSLERITEAPGNSFLLLELAELAPSGVYGSPDDEDHEAEEDTRRWLRDSEELVEVGNNYFGRNVWDEGLLDFDERGRQIPLPRTSRIVVRWLRGKVLLVAKGSLWNGDPSTYDGRHNRMTSANIREVIESSLRRSAA